MKTKQTTGPTRILEDEGLQGCSDKEKRWKRNVGAFAMSALIVSCIYSKLIHVRRNLRKKYRI
jgi:hypothetical protein